MESLTSNNLLMAEIHYIKGSININSNAQQVWKALTHARYIKLYMDANIKTDWQSGSEIIWETENAGMQFSNNGKVVEVENNKLLKYSYSGNIHDADASEDNYSLITWSIENSMDGLTTLTYQRENISTLEERAMLEEHMPFMLDEIKRIAEQEMV